MAGRLQDKVAIVTGAGSRGSGVGNGKAASLLFAREGARVCLVDNVLVRAEETLAEIEKEGGEAFAIAGDVSKDADCKHIVDACVMRFGKIDILHNNVGIDPGVVSVVDVDEKTWDEVMNVNVKSMMFMSKHAVPVIWMEPASGSSSYRCAEPARPSLLVTPNQMCPRRSWPVAPHIA
jgi:NAD(P)-dependent dehydrogenase (short-subunit alcohol dehydrogenase family)